MPKNKYIQIIAVDNIENIYFACKLKSFYRTNIDLFIYIFFNNRPLFFLTAYSPLDKKAARKYSRTRSGSRRMAPGRIARRCRAKDNQPGVYPPINPGAQQLSGDPEQGEANGSSYFFRYLVGWCCSPYAV